VQRLLKVPERVASCRCLGVLSDGVLEFPQTGFVFLGHRSGSHLYGTMKTSVVALGDLIENVDPAMSNRVKETEQTVYRIKKVIRRRRNDALVKWMG
jgi:hypothetical protein